MSAFYISRGKNQGYTVISAGRKGEQAKPGRRGCLLKSQIPIEKDTRKRLIIIKRVQVGKNPNFAIAPPPPLFGILQSICYEN